MSPSLILSSTVVPYVASLLAENTVTFPSAVACAVDAFANALVAALSEI